MRSSTVTIPAVPPYSSTTSAVCRPLARICADTASPSSVEGTTATGWARSASRRVGALGARQPKHLLDVHDADGFVEVALDDGEAGVAGFDRLGDQIGDGVVGVQRLDLGARRQQLFGGACSEPQ